MQVRTRRGLDDFHETRQGSAEAEKGASPSLKRLPEKPLDELHIRHSFGLNLSGHSRLGRDIRVRIDINHVNLSCGVHAEINSGIIPTIEQLEDEVEDATQAEPLLVGMDKNHIASELAFYRTKHNVAKGEEKEGLLYTTGRQVFGMESLMYQYWFQKGLQDKGIDKDLTLILVTREQHELMSDRISSSGWEIGAVKELKVKKNGIPVGQYYYALAKRRQDF